MSDALNQQLEKMHSELKDLHPRVQARLFFLAGKLTEIFKFDENEIPALVRCNLDRWPDWIVKPAPEGIIAVEILNADREADSEFEVIIGKRRAYLRPRLREDITKFHQIKINYCRALALVATRLEEIEELAMDPELSDLLERQFKCEQEIKRLEMLACKEEECLRRKYIRETLAAANNCLTFKKLAEVHDRNQKKIKNIRSIQSIIREQEFYFACLVKNNKEIVYANLDIEELLRLCELHEPLKEQAV